MLKVLRIRNFALMEDLTIEFDSGLTVITGETGTGKSMIVEAIASLCGERMDDISIRSGKDCAEITGIFEVKSGVLQKLNRSGITIDNELIIRRKIERGKRQNSYINDQIVSLGLLKDLTREMVDLVGQYENQSLFFPKNHLSLLDAYLGIGELKKKYRNHFHEYKELQNKLTELLDAIKQRDEKVDYLKYQIDEIEKAKIRPGEEEDLNTEKNLLLSSEKRAALAEELITTLYETEGSVSEHLFKVQKDLDNLSELDPHIAELEERVEPIVSTIEDIYREITSYRNKIEFSQERLDNVLERLDVINKIKKKYGKTLQDINDYLNTIRKELVTIESRDDEIQKIQAAIQQLEKKVNEQAESLSSRRRKACVALQKKILELLRRLGMEKAAFEIRISDKELDEDGRDDIEFFISTNPGEDLKPLRRIASGGEISRITLSLKTLLSEVDKISTVIFDEVDSGIGGRIAEAVGELLATVSKEHQVICITHLPQITVFAGHHMLVQKEIKGKQTFAKITQLDDDMRKLEVARMLGGKDITKKTVEHATEFLQKVRKR